MWHEGVWEGFGGKEDVFASRPQMATAKALMINTAYRYHWTRSGSCVYDDVDRFKQGWGTGDLERLYRRAALTSVIDESDPILPLEVKRYPVQVPPDRKELNVTLVYTDPVGLVGATQARVNDLSLRVTAPDGTVSSNARTDLSRPTKSGTIMCGNTTISRRGRTGCRDDICSVIIFSLFWQAGRPRKWLRVLPPVRGCKVGGAPRRFNRLLSLPLCLSRRPAARAGDIPRVNGAARGCSGDTRTELW